MDCSPRLNRADRSVAFCLLFFASIGLAVSNFIAKPGLQRGRWPTFANRLSRVSQEIDSLLGTALAPALFLLLLSLLVPCTGLCVPAVSFRANPRDLRTASFLGAFLSCSPTMSYFLRRAMSTRPDLHTVSLITGASSGFGLSLSKLMVARGSVPSPCFETKLTKEQVQGRSWGYQL